MVNKKKAKIAFETIAAGDAKPKTGFSIRVADRSLLGKEAVFEIEKKTSVKDSRPVNRSQVIFSKRFLLQSETTFVEIDKEQLRAYTYHGSKIDIALRTKLKVDDGILFDTTVTEEQELRLGTKPSIADNAKMIIDPHDQFNLSANIKAIPLRNRITVRTLFLIGALVVGSNTYVGWHDQFAPDGAHYFYSHYDSDGDAQSPLLNSVGVSGGIGALIWFLIRQQLRRYMTFKFKSIPSRISRDSFCKLSDMLAEIPRVDLKDVVVRVAACNMECGQYKRGSGTQERTVSFKEPVRAVLLFEKSIPHIPRGMPVESYLTDPLSFKEMFAALYPPNMVADTHGLSVHWEVQLLHEQFVDQELVGNADLFEYNDFLEA